MVFYQLAAEPTIIISTFDVIVIPLLFFFVFIFFRLFILGGRDEKPYLNYFLPAIMIKMMFSLIFCTIYIFFYGGDTHAYFYNIHVLINLFYDNPMGYFKILFGGPEREYFYYFTNQTMFPYMYMYGDPNTFIVSRVISAISFFTHNSFYVTSLLASLLSFSGLWKLYEVFCKRYPSLYKQFAVSIIFLPSMLFWSSGIVKEAILIMAIGWFIWSFDSMIGKKFSIKHLLILLFCARIIMIVKPYVFLTLAATLFIWAFYGSLTTIKNRFLRKVTFPFVMVAAFFGFTFFYSSISGDMGTYGSVEGIIKKARITQEDMIREEQYGKNSFYIGKIGDNPIDLIKLFPAATIAGIFRPFLWEARNPFMLISGLENFAILSLTLFLLFRRSIFKAFKFIFQDSFLVSIVFFSIFFAFGVGLSTSNFGALVRLKIPMLPFYISSLFIIRYYYNDFMKTQTKKSDVKL